ncbi:MAG TPA: hypothetical protein VJ752_08840 [Burkholderiaceae bacterium]|nr:hypothetical protein [Burkholderiaceae bacterium]
MRVLGIDYGEHGVVLAFVGAGQRIAQKVRLAESRFEAFLGVRDDQPRPTEAAPDFRYP